jgi:putative SOS response-associated peptidase YedK
VKSRRCLIPANGFYEWARAGEGKQPHFIHFADGRTFAFAGLWERWLRGSSGPLETCTIITTRPNELVAGFHDRMPVILFPDRHAEWLERVPLAPEKLQDLLAPCPANEMEAYPVSTYVNNPRNEGPECVVRLE